MFGLLGQTFVVLGLVVASAGIAVGYVGGWRHAPMAAQWARRAMFTYFGCMLLANFTMVSALLAHDFSVGYVAQVGSRSTPLHITIVSLWSALEGSILFWGLILGGYGAALAYGLRRRNDNLTAFALATVMVVGAFFALMLFGPADPFLPVSPVPPDGPGPNPLLQNHPLMIIHPPMLYLGYVGMTLPFAVAVAALLRGELSDAWLKVLRRTTMVAWMFLTVGIVLGGWWAYEVLGWGGYWAWDPVENASFLPWLAATAYLHSTVVQERRRMLKAWTLSLVVAAFLLTILGTFMTRSGVFNSVHSFTQSEVGPIFFGFLIVLTVASVALLAGRSHLLTPEDRIAGVLSRESAFLLNNVVLVVFTFTVLLGTVFPMVTEAWQGKKISVGEPYFDSMAIPLGLALVFLMGVGPSLPWGRAGADWLWRGLGVPAMVGVVAAAAAHFSGVHSPMVVLTLSLCAFATFVTLRELVTPALQRAKRRSEPLVQALWASASGQRRRTGGYIVHLGVLGTVVAIALSHGYKHTEELMLVVGQTADVGGYKVTYVDSVAEDQSHRFSVGAKLKVEGRSGDRELIPRLNFYASQREPVGSPEVWTQAREDFYVSLLHIEKDGSRIALKVFVIPAVAMLWSMLPFFIIGSLIALWPHRQAKVAAPAAARGASAS